MGDATAQNYPGAGNTCAGDGTRYLELNRALVEQGWAIAYRQYSSDYIASELHAKTHKLGIWSATFMEPEAFRATKRPDHQAVPPKISSRQKSQTYRSSFGCAIKGNRNRKGEWIYHLPGMPYYDITRPEELFCTEEEAQAAGYRRAIVRP